VTLAFGGDPTVLGWTITVAYALVAWGCWRARAARGFWRTVAVVLAVLCVNKQLDAQTWITAFVRDLAKEQGWYAARRGVQVAVAVVALVAVGGVAIIAMRSLRGRLAQAWPAIAGLAVIGAYIALRVTSIHEVDVVMVRGPMPAKVWAELAGLALIALGARSARAPV
jgi:hypothetical protein